MIGFFFLPFCSSPDVDLEYRLSRTQSRALSGYPREIVLCNFFSF